MWNFLKRHKGLHIWLLSALGLLGLYRLSIRSVSAADRLTAATQRLKDSIGVLCSYVSFSVMECLIVALVAGLMALLVVFVYRLVKDPCKGTILYRGAMTVLCLALTGLGLYDILWGANNYASGFQERSGIWAEPVALDDLERVTAGMVDRLQELSPQIPRDKEGVFAVPRQEILEGALQVYAQLEEEFPFLKKEDQVPKPMAFSRLFSAMNFTGFYSPFTGESNINVDSPACLMAANIAHELGHQRGIASEQECNFLAVAASLSSGDPVYQYSGALMAYIHLGNALYRADRDRWLQLRDRLPEGVMADLRYHSIYWDRFRGVTAEVSKKVYDSTLKAYGQEDGIKSYGTCVDLLVAYYK